MSHTFAKPPEPLELTGSIKRGANWKKFIVSGIFEVTTGIDKKMPQFKHQHLKMSLDRKLWTCTNL